VELLHIWSKNLSPKNEAKMADIEELYLTSLSVFVCKVNMKLARSVQKFHILTNAMVL
jgi:hypothetical protein